MKNKFEFFLFDTVLIMLVFSASFVLATLPPFEPKTRTRGQHVAVISTPEKEKSEITIFIDTYHNWTQIRIVQDGQVIYTFRFPANGTATINAEIYENLTISEIVSSWRDGVGVLVFPFSNWTISSFKLPPLFDRSNDP